MWPLSAEAQAALRGSHTVSYRAWATPSYGTAPVALPISGGSVTYDATQQVRRTASLVVADPSYWDALAPFGSTVEIDYGVTTQAGVEWVPLITGPATASADKRPRDPSTGFTVSVSDPSLLVAQQRYEQPNQTVVGATTTAEITRLIREVQPTATVTDLTGDATPLAQITIERERWADGIEAMATGIGAECFADRVGNFIIRTVPTLADDPVWTIDEGSGGVLVGADRTLDRTNVYNAVIVSGQRTDGTAPALASVYDTAVGSPTFYGGPFGRKPRFYSSATITTAEQAQTAATALLARAKGTAAVLNFTAITHPGIDPGDVILSVVDGVTMRHIVDQVTIPLDPATGMTVNTRTDDLPQES